MSEITRYEIVAQHKDGGKIWLIGYTPRLSRPGMIAALQNVGQEIIDKLTITNDDMMSWHKGASSRDPRCHIGPWRFWFSGNTKLDCRGCEHPFIAS